MITKRVLCIFALGSLSLLFACGGGGGAICGNGLIEPGEQCDDGNTQNGDLCPSNCQAGFEGNEATCTDLTDNDLDGAVDCDDDNCANTIACGNTTPENNDVVCNNCLDDDGDGFADCQDFDCQGLAICQGQAGDENTCATCSDGVSNDGDQFIDCQDFDCSQSGLPGIENICPVENNDALCSDGLDNDGDGFTDCDDFSCTPTAACGATPEDNDAACSDGISNDGDQFIDCEDFDCSQNPNVTVCDAGAVDIQSVQDGTIGTGQTVTLDNVFVTGKIVAENGNITFFVQEPQGVTANGHTYPEFAGVAVFVPSGQVGNLTIPNTGDCVTLRGRTTEFFNLTEIDQVSNITIVANPNTCGTFPTPLSIPSANPAVSFADIATDTDPNTANDQAGALAETYEGVLIRVNNVVVTASPDNNLEFPVAEQGNTNITLDVDDAIFNIAPQANDTFTSLQGILSFGFGHFILLPRDANDVIP